MADAEIDAYAAEFSWIFDQICISLEGLSERQLATRPVATGNSPYTIANHVIGTTRVYALGFGCGRQVSRDRQAEFRSPATSVAEVTTRLRQTARELTVALTELSPESLDERLLPTAELWGSSPIREISRREALIESLRHAALHLGELRLTHDLVVRANSGRQPPEDVTTQAGKVTG